MIKKIEVVDVLKGLSIFTIVIYHLISIFFSNAPRAILKIAGGGATGVHVFVVASGFGLLYSHLNRPLTGTEFIKRRFSKIYIPYIIIVIISYFTSAIEFSGNREKALLSHIFLYKMFSEKYVQSFGGQLWFLSLMFQIYLMFLVFILICKRINIETITLISFLISFLWWGVIKFTGLDKYRIWNSFILQYLWEFALGMYLASKEKEAPGYIDALCRYVQCKKRAILTVVLSLFLFIVLGTTESFLSFINPIPAFVGYTGMLIFLIGVPGIGNFVSKFGMVISGFSYELFLVHIYVFILCKNYLKFDSAVVALIALAVCIIAARFYNIIVKKIYKMLKV